VKLGRAQIQDVLPELDAIGCDKIVRNSLHNTSQRLEPVDLRSDDWLRSEVLPVAIACVCEPKVAGVIVLLHIVQAREVPAVEIVNQYAGFIGCRVHEREPGSVVEVAFVAVHDLLALAAVRRGTDWVECCTSIGFSKARVADGSDLVVAVDVNGSDIDRVVEGAGPITRGVKQPGLYVVDACFVKCIPRNLSYQLLCCIVAQNSAEEFIRVRDEGDMLSRGIGDGSELVRIRNAGCQTENVDVSDVDHYYSVPVY
jgi:hypothetical protein